MAKRARTLVWTVDFVNADPNYWFNKYDSFQESILHLDSIYDVHIVTLHPTRTDDITFNGIQYHFCRDDLEIIRKVRAVNPDIINMWGFDRPVNDALIKQFQNVPKTVYFVGGSLSATKNFPHVKRIFITTEQDREALINMPSVHPSDYDKIVVCPFTPTNILGMKDYNKPERYDVIYVSDWRRIKRQDLFLRALKHVNFTRACILGARSDNEYYMENIELLRSDYRGGYIEVIDRVPAHAVPSYYHESKVAVHLSSNEGGSRVLTEVVASGVPVIVASDCASNRARIEHGINGYIVPPDPIAIAGQLQQLLDSNDLRKQIGTRAAQQANNIRSTNSMQNIFMREMTNILLNGE